MDKLSELHFLI